MSTIDISDIPISTELVYTHPTTQILLTTKPPIHMPEAGLNPLVDAAAHIFSMMGKLSSTRQYKNTLDELHAELMQEIQNYREIVQAYSYKAEHLSEYILISCYALCATLDNIISHTAWGGENKWDSFSLLKANHLSFLSPENILIILERLVSEPDTYIDVIEFMYLCLSFGLTFKQTSDFSHEQLNTISYSLYKRIRAYRGSYNKTLSPFSMKPNTPVQHKTKPKWLNVLLVGSFLLALLTGINFWFDREDPQHSSRTELNIE